MGQANKDKLSGNPVILVSHGFQTNYERGFANGLADCDQPLVLVSSDRTDYAGLRSQVRTVNLRGSQEENRPRWLKLANMVRYHVRLMLYAVIHHRSILHVIGLIDPPGLVGVLEGIWFRAICRRYVLTIHDLLPHGRHTPWNKYLYHISFRLPHRLVVHTERMREQVIMRHGVPPDRVTVMEHGIEPSVSVHPVRRPDIPSSPKLLFFGAVAAYKGLDLLLDALAQSGHQTYSLLIAGLCRDATLRKTLEQRIAQQLEGRQIVWRNEFIPEQEVADIFCNADILVLPYRHIDQSGVLFQALRYGLPVVASRVGAFEHYISEEVGVLAEPGNAESLRKALDALTSRLPDISRIRIAEIGRGFEWSQTVRPLLSVYRVVD
jgi:glycosyltransferase involved in cell wall biosynthesis